MLSQGDAASSSPWGRSNVAQMPDKASRSCRSSISNCSDSVLSSVCSRKAVAALVAIALISGSLAAGGDQQNRLRSQASRGGGPGHRLQQELEEQHPEAEDLARREGEFKRVLSSTKDKAGLESIRALHEQLDDDKDGSIEPSETGDFIRGDLKYVGQSSSDSRQNKFHRKDKEVTVLDLWDTWRKSEVHNWTVEQTVDWLSISVELPQYADSFRRHSVNGSFLPQVAVSTSFLSKVVGVENAIHRSKINLKAMDVVLFGPPKDTSSYTKDIILTSLLVLAVTGLFYAYRQNRQSQHDLRRMMSDMDGLAKAEEALHELQNQLQKKDSELETLTQAAAAAAAVSLEESSSSLLLSSLQPDVETEVEVSRLREEVELLRNELQRAEVELEDKCWVAPPVLQHWLQLTYELENASYNHKKREAEKQLQLAKEMCEKLNKKRSSLVGAFVSTHGRSIDDVDRSILEAKTALLEVTKDLSERSQRWRQIEMLCGCPIVNNPGVAALNNLVRHVGVGRVANNPAAGGAGGGGGANGSSSSSSLASSSVAGASSSVNVRSVNAMPSKGSQDDLLHLDSNDDVASTVSNARSLLSPAGGGAQHYLHQMLQHHHHVLQKGPSSSPSLSSLAGQSKMGPASTAASILPAKQASTDSSSSDEQHLTGDYRKAPPIQNVCGGMMTPSSSTTLGGTNSSSSSHHYHHHHHHHLLHHHPRVVQRVQHQQPSSEGVQKALVGTRVGPGGRRMVKSFSQDASSSMTMAASVTKLQNSAAEALAAAVSESNLSSPQHHPRHHAGDRGQLRTGGAMALGSASRCWGSSHNHHHHGQCCSNVCGDAVASGEPCCCQPPTPMSSSSSASIPEQPSQGADDSVEDSGVEFECSTNRACESQAAAKTRATPEEPCLERVTRPGGRQWQQGSAKAAKDTEDTKSITSTGSSSSTSKAAAKRLTFFNFRRSRKEPKKMIL